MQVKWFERAQQHWDEQLEYCAETFGMKTALDSIKTVEEKIDSLCRFPEFDIWIKYLKIVNKPNWLIINESFFFSI